jgi:hypothetical protein
MSDSTGNTPDPPGNQASTPARRPRRAARPAEYCQSKLTGPTEAVSLGQPYTCQAGHLHSKDRTVPQGGDRLKGGVRQKTAHGSSRRAG